MAIRGVPTVFVHAPLDHAALCALEEQLGDVLAAHEPARMTVVVRPAASGVTLDVEWCDGHGTFHVVEEAPTVAEALDAGILDLEHVLGD